MLLLPHTLLGPLKPEGIHLQKKGALEGFPFRLLSECSGLGALFLFTMLGLVWLPRNRADDEEPLDLLDNASTYNFYTKFITSSIRVYI